IRSGFFENVRVSRTQGHGLNISSSIKNIFRELWVDNVGSDSSHYGLRISDSSENFFTLGHVLNNENGIGLFNSDYNTLSHLSILNNLDHQTRLESASQITMNQIAVNSPANA